MHMSPRDLRSLTRIAGGCTYLEVPFSSSRSRRHFESVKASKDKKKFNAKNKRAAKVSPGGPAGDLQAEKKAAIVPPRINSNSNIPVRHQQRLVRAKQEAEAAATRRPYKQTFRKAKIDPEQRAEEAKREAEIEAARRKNEKESPLVSLQNLYGTSGKEHPPILLVDGYNVLFKFVDYTQLTRPTHPVAKAQSFEDQRDAFQVSTNAYSHLRGIKVVIAYDATNRPTDPVFLDIRTSSRQTLAGGVDVVFCSDQSADSWLVREVDNLQQEGKTPQILVATDDNEVVSTCFSRGGLPLPSQCFVGEILDAEKETARFVQSSMDRMDFIERRRRGLFDYKQTGGLLRRSPELQALKMRLLAKEQIQKAGQPPLNLDREP